MSATPPPRRWRCGAAVRALLALPVLLAGLVAGCGQETPPGEAVPALAERLDRVDAAVEERNYRRATDAVRALVTEATRAEEAGEIPAEQADRIRSAARTLLARLPVDTQSQEPSPTPSPSPTETPDPSPEEGDDEGEKDKDEKDEDKDDKGKGKGEEKGEGRGTGNSGENDPYDGHGD